MVNRRSRKQRSVDLDSDDFSDIFNNKLEGTTLAATSS